LKDILTELENPVMHYKKSNIYGNIAFDNVSFAYPSRPNTMILSNLTFEVQRGETVAILGANGSGKVSHCLFLQQYRLFFRVVVYNYYKDFINQQLEQ
jgi:ABC-type bacteriocin/lantibiotic exporter with double-glycine peptidase domain